MKTQIARDCENCGRRFWGSVAPRTESGLICPGCRAARRAHTRASERTTTALARITGDGGSNALALAIPNEATFVHELRSLIDEAHTDYPLRQATLWERVTLRGDRPRYEEWDRKRGAQEAVRQVIARAQAMFRGISKVQVARHRAEADIINARNEVLAAYLNHLQLLEQIRCQRQETFDVPAPEPVKSESTESDPDPEINFVMERQRRKVRELALANQATISEFLKLVRKIFNNRDLEKSERVLRIRSLMDAFGKSEEELPANIRKFLATADGEGEPS